MDLRKESVLVETDRYRVEGRMTRPAEGYGSRLSDHVNRRDLEFFTVTDAQLTPLDGGEVRTVPLLMLASKHVRLIVPAAEG